MNFEEVIPLVVSVGLVMYGIYGSIKVTKAMLSYKKNKQLYNEKNKNHVEIIKDYNIWLVGYGISALISVVLLIEAAMRIDILYTCVYVFLLFVIYILACETYMKRQIMLAEIDFFFDSRIIRYRSVSSISPRKGIFPIYMMYINGQDSGRLTRKIGEEVLAAKQRLADRKKNK